MTGIEASDWSSPLRITSYRWPCRAALIGRPALVVLAFLATGPVPVAAGPNKTTAAGWTPLFDGKSLKGWAVIDQYDFRRHGQIFVKDGHLHLEAGDPATGVRWLGEFPRMDYEVALEGMRVHGHDFFCGMTFPVGQKALTLVVGGWGGPVTGLSSIDGEPAVENETCQHINFERGRWYAIRVRVMRPGIEVWLDKEKIIDLKTANRDLTIYWEVEPCLPFGIATWRTTGAIRNVRIRRLAETPPEREGASAKTGSAE